MSKETIKALRGLMIFAALLVLAVLNVKEVLLAVILIVGIFKPFIIGAAVAFIINIPMKAMEQRLFAKENKLSRWSRPISFILSILAIVLVFWIVYMLVVPQLGKTISELAVKIPLFLRDTIKYLMELFKNNPELQQYIASFDFTSWDWNSIISKAANMLGNGIGSVVISTVNVAGSIFGVVFDGVIAFVFAIYLLMQKDTLANQGLRVMQAYLPKRLFLRTQKVLQLLYKNFSNFISSQCLEAVILGSLFVVTLLVLGFPYAVLIGTLIAVTALVPIVGAFVGCGVGAFLILVDDPVRAIGFVVIFLVLQQLEGNLIYPKVVGSSVGLPAIWVLMAVSVGGSLFGVVGMLVFIPITSTLYILLKEDVNERNFQKEKLRKQIEAECKKSKTERANYKKSDSKTES